jgi:YD repeat-containing protein
MRSRRAKESVVIAERSMISGLCVWLLTLAFSLVCPAQAQMPRVPLGLEARQPRDLAPPMPRDRIRERGIRSVAVWRYPVAADGVEGEGTQILLIEYDRRGNVALRTALGGQDSVVPSPSEYRYDRNGRIAEAEYPPGELGDISRMTFHYDDEGRLAESVSYLADGTRGPTVKYEYDAAGRPVKVSTETFEGEVLNAVAVEYKPDGNVSRVVLQGPGGESTLSTTVLSYDASRTPTEQVTADNEGRVLARTTYTYDALGNPTEVAAFSGEGRIISRLSYSYDERGNITRIVQAYPAAGLRTRTDLRYDASGDLQEQVLYNKLNRPVEIIRYVYDHHPDR